MPFATLRWLHGEEEIARHEGNFGLVMHNFMKVSGEVVKRPTRTDELKKAGWKEHQTAEPTLHEGTSLRLFFDDLCCEITFSTVFEAGEYLSEATALWKKKSAPKSAPIKAPEVLPKPAPEPPRKKQKIDDDGFEVMSNMNTLRIRNPVAESLNYKRAVLDSKVVTKTSDDRPLARPSQPLRRMQPQRNAVLQRKVSNPLQDSSVYHGYRSSLAFGLQNLGNTCYLNAVTQAVGASREFVGELTSMATRWPHCTNGPLFKCSVDILQRLQAAQNAPLSPAKLREQIAIAAPMFRGSGQQDAHEFFLEYINQLHGELLRGHKDCLARTSAEDQEPVLATQNHFDAELLKQLTCTQCGKPRQVTERFRDFSLDFRTDVNPLSIEAMFRSYFDAETVEAKCEHCEATSALLETQLSEAPRVLVLHLKRFVPNIEQQRYEKQHQSVQIPYMLDVEDILGKGSTTGVSPARLPARPLASTATPAAGAPGSEAEPAEGPVYKLRAVVSHEGASPRSGHYVCYAESAKGEWFLFDDSRVKQFAAGEEPWTTLGSKAYMLFYVLAGSQSPDPS
ncbi:Ubiquitin carboxyl-terminal hydrolase 23 [Symbiodinium microadriaticum]|uniref:Ubiquitin carboxyl-terminal hydrolase 23 n=1 Tax=Symbiodinium microadriaticum TaxID=2951 RepID=A0A1Q9D722_SYMMI|nr:Ubiquitin carboxyl-terminal hydrolase 23 [Symbiodinium microadriaticum]